MPVPSPTPAAIYARCSTEEQADRNLSIPAQVASCERWAQQNGLAVAATYLDAGLSGGLEERPGIDGLLSAAARGEFSSVLIWDTARLAREEEFAFRWTRMLREAGVDVVFVSQPYIDQSAEGMMMHGNMATFDAYWRRKTSFATRRGVRQTVTQNHHWSGGRPPYGFRLVDKSLVIDDEQAEIVREVVRLRAEQGLGLVRLAAHLNSRCVPTPSGHGTWCQAKLHRVLVSPAICGTLSYDTYPRGPGGPRERVEIPGACPAIITPEEFATIGLRSDRAKWRQRGGGVDAAHGPMPTRRRRTHTLAGLLRCCECGDSMGWRGGGASGRPSYYSCRSWRGRDESGCRGPFVRPETAEPRVIEAVLEMLTDDGIASIAAAIAEQDAMASEREGRSRASLASRLSRVERELSRLADAIARGAALESVLEAMSSRESERDALRSELSAMESLSSTATAIRSPGVSEWLEATREELRSGAPPRQNAILFSLLAWARYDPRSDALHLEAYWPVTSATSPTGSTWRPSSPRSAGR